MKQYPTCLLRFDGVSPLERSEGFEIAGVTHALWSETHFPMTSHVPRKRALPSRCDL